MIHNKTNARFVSGVSKNTDYLISSRKDTNKAKRAKARSVKEETHPFALFNIDMYTPHVC